MLRNPLRTSYLTHIASDPCYQTTSPSIRIQRFPIRKGMFLAQAQSIASR
jgi:hypothetical protein